MQMGKQTVLFTRRSAFSVSRSVAMWKRSEQGPALSEKFAQLRPICRLQIKDKQIIWPLTEIGEDGFIMLMVDVEIVPPRLSHRVFAAIDEVKHRILVPPEVAHQTVRPVMATAARENEF